jgi:hypothetical protein
MIRGLIALALFIALLQAGFLFASPMVKNSMLEGKMRELARSKTAKSETSLLRDIMEFVDEKGIPLDEKEIVIVVKDNKATIAAHYTTQVKYLKYVHRYEFFPASDERARMTWKRQGKKAVRSY